MVPTGPSHTRLPTPAPWVSSLSGKGDLMIIWHLTFVTLSSLLTAIVPSAKSQMLKFFARSSHLVFYTGRNVFNSGKALSVRCISSTKGIRRNSLKTRTTTPTCSLNPFHTIGPWMGRDGDELAVNSSRGCLNPPQPVCHSLPAEHLQGGSVGTGRLASKFSLCFLLPVDHGQVP